MAGYLGTKAVLLSTTAADVVGNAEIGGDLTVGGAFTSQGIDDNASATAMTLDASGNVGIGTSSPSGELQVQATNPNVYITSANTGQSDIYFGGTTTPTKGRIQYSDNADLMAFWTNSSERMRIDSSGNLLVGTTSDNVANQTSTAQGVRIAGPNNIQVASTAVAAYFNKLSTDGDIVEFRKSGSKVGSIGATNNNMFVNADGGNYGILQVNGSNRYVWYEVAFYPEQDNVRDLGTGTQRWDDIYATNGTIQTSDRNEKQDIEALSDAEQRVAVACKGLLRKFRWKDAVAEKGDNARIHFGIIAQDLQDAFAAEGLDAGRYAMFISSTWWETQTEVPAVEAVAEVLDEDGNVVTEAVEAKEAYTRTDTYETLEEAPEGATERTRLGVRYPELLAFIIGAM